MYGVSSVRPCPCRRPAESALEFRREFVRIFEVEEVLPRGLFETQSPQVEQRLIDIDESPLAVEDVGEVGDVREGGFEQAHPPLQPAGQLSQVVPRTTLLA